MTILEAIHDRHLFGPWFAKASWRAWRIFLAAVFALPIESEDLEVYRRHTGRTEPPTVPTREVYALKGRRGGGSRIAGFVAVYLGCFRDYSAILAPGEVGTVMIIAADRRQARVIMRYVNGFLDGVPMLRAMVEHRTAESVTLSNRVVIEVHSASFRAVRGYTIVAAILDEVAFWRTDEDAAEPDTEIIAALRPGMATVPGALLLAISSPYARRGALWDAYRQHYGRDGDPVLVWQAPSAAMNPTIDPQVIADAYEQDPDSAAAEYGAEFRRDVEAYVTREAVDACTIPGRYELGPCPRLYEYFAFTDPSGGSQDSFTLAIAHLDSEDRAILDLVREVRPPFNPEAVVRDFAAVLAPFGLRSVTGDRYAGEWVSSAFAKFGVGYQPSQLTKSELYAALLARLNSTRCQLLDDRRLIAQLVSLERRTSRGGKDSIDHPPRAHDDLANAAAGALVMTTRPQGGMVKAVYG